MAERWREAVLDALNRYAARQGSRMITRQAFLRDELQQIASDTATQGATPHQTVSRVLQELRDEGVVEFVPPGRYLLLDSPIDVETEELPASAIDAAITRNKLRLGVVETRTADGMARQRRGQDRLRQLIMVNYRSTCAVCDVCEPPLLVASHVVRWAEGPEIRGDLRNVLCLCRFHDTLFENGYWSLKDNWEIIKRTDIKSRTVALLLEMAPEFRAPACYGPAPQFLRRHRIRCQFE